MKISRVNAILFKCLKHVLLGMGLLKRGNTDGVRNQTEPQVLAWFKIMGKVSKSQQEKISLRNILVMSNHLVYFKPEWTTSKHKNHIMQCFCNLLNVLRVLHNKTASQSLTKPHECINPWKIHVWNQAEPQVLISFKIANKV